MEKSCTDCGETKPLSAFYSGTAKCKPCTSVKRKAHRATNLETIREYDRKRGNRQGPEYSKEYRKKYPNKYKAHTLVGNAKRDGYLHEESCQRCGSEDSVHAHHDDYLKPLNIRWLCAGCHKQWHEENGEGANP